MLACRADMPPSIGAHYTEGERAVLTVIAAEIRAHGFCALHVDEIARRAGVSRSTVINARRQAVLCSDISWRERRVPGTKSKTNVICIIKAEWLAWIRRSRGIGVGCKTKFSHPTEKKIQNREATSAPVERQHRIRLECG